MRKSDHKIENNKFFTSAGIPNVSPVQALEMCRSGAAIIDIRGDYLTAFKKFDVPDVIYFPEPGKSIPFNSLEKEKTYIVSETSTSVSSREIVRLLLNEGFQPVYNLAGGFVEWERDGLPVIENKNARLSGSCMCQLRPRDK
ncbi:MAG: rhodanese-like domain-containing protein [Bacteroidales bacterium]|nr:rhodanese-like domain-containing protein [Bacteroidales bacterium]